uniref:Protein-lysine N-methyltransferase n=1 Tax=Glossina austeni TaxID=7395 RepID=A0A1A9VU02_GLOAU
MSNQELAGSELGTKSYWDQAYSREIKNYKCHGDVGEIWFGEDSQFRIIDWILKHYKAEHNARIIDLGCGNGMLLIELARERYVNLLGVDYSPEAITLAQKIAHDQGLKIRYSVADLMDAQACSLLGEYDVVHDKGTYDAVSLCPHNPKEKRLLYMDTVCRLTSCNGIFIITSCNWTEEELINAFQNLFTKYCTIPTPSFKFGGKIGNVVTSIVFKKKNSLE